MSRYVEAEFQPTPEALAAVVDGIISVGVGQADPEVGHYEEDALHRQIIEAFCPDWVVAEVQRLAGARFPRWCA